MTNKEVQPGNIVRLGTNKYMIVCKIQEFDNNCFTFYGNIISPNVARLTTFKDVEIVNTDFTLKEVRS